MQEVSAYGVAIIECPAQRTGAEVKICSFYFRVPDSNSIEAPNQISSNKS